MLCQECKKEPAIVHMMHFVNGQSMEKHLCESCARKQGISFGEDFSSGFTINNLLSGLMEMDFGGDATQTLQAPAVERCPQCGQSFMRFQRTGRLGCASCYNVFGKHLQPLLRRVHGATEHRGKVPLRSGKAVQAKRHLENLRLQMQQAIREERFEAAAELRDQIRTLERDSGVSK